MMVGAGSSIAVVGVSTWIGPSVVATGASNDTVGAFENVFRNAGSAPLLPETSTRFAGRSATIRSERGNVPLCGRTVTVN